jgi:CDP-diacylglycerol--glycerol-3-phosphate 3-phosphatidyltransferase
MTIDKTLQRQEAALSSLQGSLLRLAFLWAAVWLLTYLLLQQEWESANRWLLLSGIVLASILWHVRRKLALNHAPLSADLLPELGPGNQLTLVRGLLLGLLAGFLFSPWPMGALAWFVAGIYTAASLTDAFDGVIARRSGRVTKLGQLLDVELDGLGVLIVILLAVGYGQLPAWFLLVALARYLFVFGLWWRERRGQATYDLPPSVHRRILAGMLMGMLTVVLWPIVPAAMSHLAAPIIGVPILAGFLRDWLFASGRLTGSSAVYQQFCRAASRVLTVWLPPLLRLLLFASMMAILLAGEPWYRPSAWEALLHSWGVPVPGSALLSMLLAMSALVGATLVALGMLPRLLSITLLFPIGFSIATAELNGYNGLALVCVLLITFFGSGPYALWRPEEAFLVPLGRREAH